MKKDRITVAIDGPVGSGKGTLGVALAKKLGALYLYTGGMYRALTLACLREKIDIKNEEGALKVLKKIDLRLKVSQEETEVFLGNELVNDQIFLPEVSKATPIIAAMPKVREEMVRRQKKLVEGQSAVIEGRDIATHVAQGADIKIFLTADLLARAKRRYEQFKKRRIEKPFKEVLEDTKLRDKQDRERKVSPLTVPPEAVVIDTTQDTVEDTVDKVIKELEKKGLI